jgi:hypothetical protein
MNPGVSIEQVLRWRLARAEAEAPPAPRAERLLELTRPWWERWPEQFRLHLARLRQMPLAYGYAMVGPAGERRGHPVPTLITDPEGVETYAQVTYLKARDARLRMRFQVDGVRTRPETFEATFVSDESESPLCVALASRSYGDEYWVDVELPDQLARSWAPLRVTDKMPFRLILRPANNAR